MMLHIEFSTFLTTPFNFASTTPPPTPSLFLLCEWAISSNSNLVLTDADGRVRVAWQTNTENKGVVGLKLLPTGNMVFYNSMTKGNFIWQSFDYQQTLY
ncbi:unnamed protein product [Prunus brigantina]